MGTSAAMAARTGATTQGGHASVRLDHHWYKDAVIYQLHVRSFADSNADGTGDFDGLTSRLDYLVDLGIDTVWLLPFFPSPLRDDGYDIADYGSINPAYGDLPAFRRFLKAAHARGLRVIIELVMNHTSDAHPWFQRARRAPAGSRQRNYYVWSDTPERYSEARIIFQDFETSNWTWDPIAQQYYWHRFYSHQPDLNFEHVDVKRAMFATLDRWFHMGVDGVRLDAVPYLYEEDGTNCENLPRTHEFLRELRAHVDRHFPDRLLLAEANQWPEDAVTYFGNGDECHMAFHFPVMPRLFMAVQMESRTPVVDILEQTPDIPESCQWAMFLRNHDELTLEMVTDEERDYMYRRFAGDQRMRVNLGIRRRLGPLLQDDRRTVELMNGLLFSLPGTPIVYYGDEIGMGDNVYLGDRDAVRTPMQWSSDRNAGFSQCNPQRLFLPLVIDPQHHYEAINVEAQRRNPASLWWWMRRLIALRRRHIVFGRGRMVMIDSDNPKVLTFIRTLGDGAADAGAGNDDVLVVANLARHAQQVTIPLARYAGVEPVELMGQTRFERVSEAPYRVTLGPHDFFWLRLPPMSERRAPAGQAMPHIAVRDLRGGLDRVAASTLADLLPDYLVRQRWFGDRSRPITDTTVLDTVPLTSGEVDGTGVIAQVDFASGEPQWYFVPVALRRVGGEGERRERERRGSDAAVLATAEGDCHLVDASVEPGFTVRVVRAIIRGERLNGTNGTFVGRPADGRHIAHQLDTGTVRPLGVEQSNSSSIIGERAVLKVLRRVEPGVHPEVELLRHLTQQGFTHAPALLGTLEHCATGTGAATTIATLIEYVPSEGDAWELMRGEAARFYDWAAATQLGGGAMIPAPSDVLTMQDLPDDLPEPLVEALDRVQLLGRRTADLHRALAAGDEPRFRPEPFTRLYQRAMYQALRSEARAVFAQLRHSARAGTLLPPPEGEPFDIGDLTAIEASVLSQYHHITDHRIDCDRIRIHGDLHLAQVLGRGGEVAFIDFEGEPARPLGERAIKRSGLVDVAGMVRSFDYVAHQGLLDAVHRGVGTADGLRPCAEIWESWTTGLYVSSYLREIGTSRIIPHDPGDVRTLLDVLVLRKAVFEVRYELDRRPDWVWIPLRALTRPRDAAQASERSGR
jgi:maltose alpha-D-glucosyltransferase/alpha-amylase